MERQVNITQKTVWLDSKHVQHDSEADAICAERRYAAEHVIDACFDDYEKFDFGALERLNHQTLQPLLDYMQFLVDQSKERTEKFG